LNPGARIAGCRRLKESFKFIETVVLHYMVHALTVVVLFEDIGHALGHN